MGTSNFYYKNASRVYAIGMNYEANKIDDDGNETDEKETVYPDEWEIMDELDNIQENMKGYEYGFTERVSSYPELRSFPSSPIGTWYIEKQYAGVWIEVHLSVVANSGYYEGACLDYITQLYMGGNEIDEMNADDLAYYSDKINIGLAKSILKHVNKWIDKTRTQMEADAEKLFAEMCGIELSPIATFSNGETIYKQVKKAS